jgi:hypothetical protein
LGSFKAKALNTDGADQTDSHGVLSAKIRAIRVIRVQKKLEFFSNFRPTMALTKNKIILPNNYPAILDGVDAICKDFCLRVILVS